MKNMKNLDFQILSELFKNSKTSDRKMAKTVGVSQPTITRRRAQLEKDVIDSYTIIPRWEKLGYKLLVITLLKLKISALAKAGYESRRKMASDWMMKHSNIIMQSPCRGSNIDAFMISVHKDYADYDQLANELRRDKGEHLESIQPLIVNLTENRVTKPLSFKYLAEAK